MTVKYCNLTLLIVFLLVVTGCGIKPKNVSAPNTDTEDQFPAEYPDASTDPAPKPKAVRYE